jgi:hypothetical protein
VSRAKGCADAPRTSRAHAGAEPRAGGHATQGHRGRAGRSRAGPGPRCAEAPCCAGGGTARREGAEPRARHGRGRREPGHTAARPCWGGAWGRAGEAGRARHRYAESGGRVGWGSRAGAEAAPGRGGTPSGDETPSGGGRAAGAPRGEDGTPGGGGGHQGRRGRAMPRLTAPRPGRGQGRAREVAPGPG